MKALSSIIVTCLITGLLSVITFTLLYLLFMDLMLYGDMFLLGSMAITIVTIPVMIIFTFLPVYLFNRIYFAENTVPIIYARFLFIPLLFVLLPAGTIMLNNPEGLILAINMIISVFTGFYIFIKFIK